MKKRILCLLLVVCMVMSMLSTTVLAEEATVQTVAGTAQFTDGIMVNDVVYVVGTYNVDTSTAYGDTITTHYAQCVDMSGCEVNLLIGVEKYGTLTGGSSVESGFYYLDRVDNHTEESLGIQTLIPMPTAYDADTAPYYVQSSAQGVVLTEDAQSITTVGGETAALTGSTRYVIASGAGSVLEVACVVGGVNCQTDTPVHIVLGKDEQGNREVQAMFLAADPTKIVVTDCLYVSKEQTEYVSARADGYQFEVYSANTGELLSLTLSVQSMEQGFYTYHFDEENKVYELFPYVYEGVTEGQYLQALYNGFILTDDLDHYGASKAVIVDTRSEKELDASDYGEVTTLDELAFLLREDCVVKLDVYVNTESETVQTIFVTHIIPPVVPALDNILRVVCSYCVSRDDAYGNETTEYYAQCVDMSGKEVNVLVGAEKYGELTGVSSVNEGFYYLDRVDSSVEEKLGIQTLTPMPTAYDADIAPYYVQSSEQGVTLTESSWYISSADGTRAYLTDSTRYITVSGTKINMEIACVVGGVNCQTDDPVYMVLSKDNNGNRLVQAVFLPAAKEAAPAEDILYVAVSQTKPISQNADGYIYEIYNAKTGELLTLTMAETTTSLEQGFWAYNYDEEDKVYSVTGTLSETDGVYVNLVFSSCYNGLMSAVELDGTNKIQDWDASKAIIVDTRDEDEMDEDKIDQLTTFEDIIYTSKENGGDCEVVLDLLCEPDPDDALINVIFVKAVYPRSSSLTINYVGANIPAQTTTVAVREQVTVIAPKGYVVTAVESDDVDISDNSFYMPGKAVTITVTVEKRVVTASGYCGGEGNGKNLTWTLYEDGELVISGSGAMINFSYISNSDSTNAPWWSRRGSVKTVTVEVGVTSIGINAFYNCTGLTSVTIPDSVTIIGDYAFYSCEGLTEIVIPDSVTSIGNDAFYYCTGLTSVTIGSSVTSIGNSAFRNCDALTTVTIPDSVTGIGSRAFYDCDALTTVTIGDSVTSIGSYAFYDCDALTTVTIGDSVTSIGNYAFVHCDALTTVTIPDSVTSIGSHAFNVCSNLKTVELGSGVQTIGQSAFMNCALEQITIPVSVTSIGDSVFGYDGNLKQIVVESGNTAYHVVDGALLTKDGTTLVAYPGAMEGESYVVPGGVTEILDAAFSLAHQLRHITLPASVASIGENVFYGSGLERITVDAGNKNYCVVDGVLFTTDMTTLVAYPANREGWCYTVPDGVELIAGGAFGHADGLYSVSLPAGVTQIGGQAFRYCTNLRSVTLESGVTTIESSAFRNMAVENVFFVGNKSDWNAISIQANNGQLTTGAAICYISADDLRDLTTADCENGSLALSSHRAPVGASITVFQAMVGGYVLTELAVDGKAITGNTFTVTDDHVVSAVFAPYRDAEIIDSGICGDNVYWTLYEDGELYISGQGAMYSDYNTGANTVPWSRYAQQITKGTIASGVTRIGPAAFYNCTQLVEISIPETVTSISWGLGYGCTKLSTITVDANNASFHTVDGVLYNKSMTGLIQYPAALPYTSYTVPDSVTSIYSTAFAGATNLEKINLSNNLAKINGTVFYNCTGLTEITVPDSVTSIGNNAFSNCTGLTTVTIGSSVTSIGSYAFNVCSNLKTVELGSGVQTIGQSAFMNCALEQITIPASVTSIGDRVFGYDENLKQIVVESGNTAYHVVDGALLTKDGTTLVAYPGAMAGETYAVPDGVTEILDAAFSLAHQLRHITLPASVASIGENVFFASGLERITVDAGNKNYCVVDGVLFTTDMTTLVVYPANREGWCYTVPDGVELIGAGAFGYADGLYSVSLPAGVTQIGSQAFRYCTNLRSVTMESGVTTIGSSAFRNMAVENVFFVGNKSDWNAISIEANNGRLTTGAVICYISADDLRDLTTADCENGSLALSSHRAPVGAQVTVFAAPKMDYTLQTILVDGKAIEGNTFTVTGSHVVTAVFEPIVDAKIVYTDRHNANLTLCVRQAGQAIVAFYDSTTGQMLDAQVFTMPTGSTEITLTAEEIDLMAADCKIILLDEERKPVCKAIEP